MICKMFMAHENGWDVQAGLRWKKLLCSGYSSASGGNFAERGRVCMCVVGIVHKFVIR